GAGDPGQPGLAQVQVLGQRPGLPAIAQGDRQGGFAGALAQGLQSQAVVLDTGVAAEERPVGQFHKAFAVQAVQVRQGFTAADLGGQVLVVEQQLPVCSYMFSAAVPVDGGGLTTDFRPGQFEPVAYCGGEMLRIL